VEFRPFLPEYGHFKDGQSRLRHVHFAFAGITSDYQVDVTKVQAQFDGLLKLKAVKRVVSFGGWSFSTDYDTFPIFRVGVSPANREAFAQSVTKFATDHNLDGLDFDWEYPGVSNSWRPFALVLNGDSH
jgi:chitinase